MSVGHCLLVQDAALLNQFICPHSGKVLPASKTGKLWVDRQGKQGRERNHEGREGVIGRESGHR